MFSSIFSAGPVDPHAPNFFSVTDNVPESDLYGPLEPKDTEWLCAGGFVTETQVFYTIIDDGRFLMCQVIHSATGLWYPTVQFTFKLYDPKTGKSIWKSLNVTNFTGSPPGLDKRSCKADQFSISFKPNPSNPEYPETYQINANLADDLQISLEVQRPASVPGWKLGKGPKGGYSYFGTDQEKPDGYVIHRVWPRYKASGHLISQGKADPIAGIGCFIHAIQGMRPNLVASAWNFHFFTSNELGGVTAFQMEFTTCDTHGKKGNGSGHVVVNLGSLVIDNKLATVVGETTYPGEAKAEGNVVSRTTHLNSAFDAETSYKAPQGHLVEWKGHSVLPDAPGIVAAKVESDVGTLEQPKGLIEKIDVLAEIPYVLKVAVNYVAGTKPYIYQWCNPAKLHLSGDFPGLDNGVNVQGTLYTESTFIS
ncbi:survival factor 1 [Coprinopsis sp. MPI-PUGE-AT-0042]|nr:survival factor 1 [Coprinopsis sp. MPI-PUGE-AT-0042]